MRLLTALFTATLMTAQAAELAEIPFETITGKKTSLADYEDKVVLIVNTASKCGLTGQYAGLEKLYSDYKAKDFVVLAFPCNDFGAQEPGTAEEIQTFCKKNYDISFPLMKKIHVKGKDQHPLYTALTGPEGAFPGDVKWNFGKFLIGKDGKAIARFEPREKPDSPKIVEAIEKAIE
ncbi:MAG: glutathione peroxidase [Verrucomicrobiota bacterium]